MIQFVGEDEVLLAENGRDRARIGGEAALKDDAGFHVLEARNLLFELHVDAHGAGNGSHRARTDAVFARGRDRCFDQLGVCRKPEIIVRGEVDDALAVVGADRPPAGPRAPAA